MMMEWSKWDDAAKPPTWRLEISDREYFVLIRKYRGKWFIDDSHSPEYFWRELEGVKTLEEAKAIAETCGRIS